MARVVAFTLVSSVAANVFEVFGNRTLSIEYHRRLAMMPYEKMREVGAVTWKVGRLARRLTEEGSDDDSDSDLDMGLSDECEMACKDKLEAFKDDFDTIMEAGEDLSFEKNMKHMGDQMACMFQAVCYHRDAFTCLADTDACKDAIKESGDDSSTSIAGLNAQAQCLCDNCPEMIKGMAEMMTGMAESAEAWQGQGMADGMQAEEMKKDLLHVMCPLIPALECAEDTDSCKTVIDVSSMTGILDAFKQGEGDTQEDELKELKQECEAEGAKMTLPETDKYGCNSIPGLDIDFDGVASAAAATAAGTASLAVAALAVLS